MTLLEATDGEERTYLDLVEAIEEESARATDDLRQLWRRIAARRAGLSSDEIAAMEPAFQHASADLAMEIRAALTIPR